MSSLAPCISSQELFWAKKNIQVSHFFLKLYKRMRLETKKPQIICMLPVAYVLCYLIFRFLFFKKGKKRKNPSYDFVHANSSNM